MFYETKGTARHVTLFYVHSPDVTCVARGRIVAHPIGATVLRVATTWLRELRGLRALTLCWWQPRQREPAWLGERGGID